jgi:hypothetical protein
MQWWMYTHVLIITILAPCCLSDQCVSINNVCTHMFYWKYYLHHGVYQNAMSDLMMNTHTCVSHSINYTMSYVRSICLIQWWMYTRVLIIAILAPCCLSDQCVSINYECTHMFYWKYYLHHCVCQISMSDLMMNIYTCVTAKTTYTMLYARSVCQI